jgi:hypothetical protein
MSQTHIDDDMEWGEEGGESQASPAESSFFAAYDSTKQTEEDSHEPYALSPSVTHSQSMAGTIWDIADLDYEITERFKGPTMESYRKDYKDYVQAIKSLPAYNADAIREEIGYWDLSVPSIDDFHYESIQEVYSRIVAYRNRLTYLLDLVNPHYELINDAIKNLKALAFKLSTGTLKDKESTATNLVVPLAKSLHDVSRIKSSLEAVHRNIDFTAFQIGRLLTERQSLSKINQGHVSEGMGHTYARQQAIDLGEEGASRLRPNSYRQPPSKPLVRTRNHRLKS